MTSVRLALVCLATGCTLAASDSSAQEQDVGTTTYVQLSDFAGIDQGAWFDSVGKLRDEFVALCGDTFCEGEYANLNPLSISCSVSSKIGHVHDCAWTFAASELAVDPQTSAIAIDAPTFVCHFHPKGTAKQLLAAWSSSSDAIHAPMPGGSGSLYDALGDCFQHPIGATPVTVVTDPAPTYVSAAAYYATAANQAKWRAVQTAMVDGFDRVCGDTFCGSDFGDLRSLEFACSITKSSGNVKACAWAFGGSYSVVATSGALDVTSQSFRCAVPVHGTLSQLITTLTTTGLADPIQRPLPGGTTSAYDALAGCLP